MMFLVVALQLAGVVLLVMLVKALVRLRKRRFPPPADGKLWQLHHGFYGAVLAIGAPFLLLLGDPWWAVLLVLALQGLGLWWLHDDAEQHLTQYHDPMYRSWWHLWALRHRLIK